MRRTFTLFLLLLLFSFASFTLPEQQNTYSIVGSWKLVGMQIGTDTVAKAASSIDSTLGQSTMRLVFEKSGKFRMELDEAGRGPRGGYYYDASSQILSIRYGTHTDTALVYWEGADRMIHSTTDGHTKTTMVRISD